MVKVNYNLSHQQIIHLSFTIYYQYLDDIGFFERHSSLFNAGFLQEFESKIRDIQNDMDVGTICQSIHKEKKQVRETCTDLRALLYQLQGYTVWAFPSPGLCNKRYGFATLISEVNRKDCKLLATDLQELLRKLKLDAQILSDAGVPNHFYLDIDVMIRRLSFHSYTLDKINTRLKEVIEGNINHSNEVWKLLQMICETGEKIFAATNPERAKLYNWEYNVKKEKSLILHD